MAAVPRLVVLDGDGQQDEYTGADLIGELVELIDLRLPQIRAAAARRDARDLRDLMILDRPRPTLL